MTSTTITTTQGQFAWITDVLAWTWTACVGWIKEMTRGEKALLLAVLFLGAVGATGTHTFFAADRGELVGWFAAVGIELLYLGSAGVAVKLPGQIKLSRALMTIGTIGSAFFNVLVGLRERLPHMFDANPVWPDWGQWVVHGGVSSVEGLIIPLSALGVAMLLHSMTSHRLIEADDEVQKAQQRRDMKPFECPFCASSFDSAPKIYGHVGRCEAYKASELSDAEKKAIVSKAVAEGKERILNG